MENRQPRQDRSEETLQAVIEAAALEMIEGGLDSVTHRRVAERAHSSLRATTYYFKSVKALRKEAMRLIFNIGHKQREERLAQLRKNVSRQAVDEILEFTYGTDFTVPGIIRFQANLLHAAADEVYSDLIAETQRVVEEQLAELLVIYGIQHDSKKVIAVIDGRLMEWVLGGGKTDFRKNISDDLGF